MTSPEGRLERPGVITLLAILGWIGGGGLLPLASLGLLGTLIAPAAERDTVLATIFAVLLVLAGAELVAALGLWKLRPYGRRLQILLSSVGLLATPVGTIVSVVILAYLIRPGIRLRFSGKPAAALSPHELTLVNASMTWRRVAAVLLLALAAGLAATIAIPLLLVALTAGNEASAINSLRAFNSAEVSYALGNRHLYDRPDCLVHPSDCIAGYSGAAFLPARLERKRGYRFVFYPGAAPLSRPPGVSSSTLTTFMMTALPVSRATGTRQFCVDHTGEVRAAPLAAEALTTGPACPADWATVK